MSMTEGFFKAVENRRTYYQLKAESPISDDEIVELVKRCVKHAPNPYNMQESRAVIVTGKKHLDLWDRVVVATREDEKDDDRFNHNKARIENAYKPGYGTVLFFESGDVIDAWTKKMPHMKEAFAVWSENAAGILQYIVWTALESKGFGCSLQHYAGMFPGVQKLVTETFELPSSWKCTAMMPFGVPAGPPGNAGHPKEFSSLEERVKVFLG